MIEEIFRTKAPEPRSLNNLVFNKPECFDINENLKVWSLSENGNNVIKLELVFDTSFYTADEKLTHVSTAKLMMEGAGDLSSQQIHKKIDMLGAEIHISATPDYTIVSALTLKEHFSEIVNLLKLIIYNARFPEKEFETLVKRSLQQYKVDRRNGTVLSRELLFESMFGKDNRYGKQISEKDYISLNTDNLKKFYSKIHKSSSVNIFISGGVDKKCIEMVSNLFNSSDIDYKLSKRENYLNKAERLMAKLDSSQQSHLRGGIFVPTPSNEDHIEMNIANMYLGGFFGSRLMKKIREEKGLSYSIGSSVLNLKECSCLVINSSLKKNTSDIVIEEIKNELIDLSDKKINDKQLKLLQNYYIGVLMRNFDGVFSVSAFYRNLISEGKDLNYAQMVLDKIRNITAEELREVYRNYFNAEKFTFVSID